MKTWCIFLLLLSSAHAANEFNVETGLLENSYNQVRIPGDKGTQINLAPAFSDSNLYYRLTYSRKLSNKNGIRLLFAPLTLRGERKFNHPVNFNNETFAANQEITTTYKFNSYRASYYHQFINNNEQLLRIGLTLKIRDAEIKLKQGPKVESRKDLGVVPLFYLFYEYQFSHKFRAALDFDGLIAPQGRAIDTALMFGRYLDKTTHLNVGYRILDGGADNDKVYTFAFINYYFLSLQKNF